MWMPLLILLAGGVAILGFYGGAFRNYVREGDGYAANVTILAAFGTFLPFVGFAAIAYGNQQTRQHEYEMCLISEQIDSLGSEEGPDEGYCANLWEPSERNTAAIAMETQRAETGNTDSVAKP